MEGLEQDTYDPTQEGENMELATGSYYVLDTMSAADKRIVSGPFEYAWDAERDRREYNIAEDCVVARWRGGQFEVMSLGQDA